MRHVGHFGEWPTWIIRASLLALAACAAAPAPSVEREFAAPPHRVREAVLAALGAPVEEEGALLRAGWRENLSPDRAQGTILEGRYVRRTRLTVRLDGSRVAVSAVVEERAPGGPRALRWQRRESDGVAEREFLRNMEDLLP